MFHFILTSLKSLDTRSDVPFMCGTGSYLALTDSSFSVGRTICVNRCILATCANQSVAIVIQRHRLLHCIYFGLFEFFTTMTMLGTKGVVAFAIL